MRIVDRVAYINHDIDDAIRAGILSQGDLPRTRSRCSGRPARSGSTPSSTTSSRRLHGKGDILQSAEIGGAMLHLRAFMFERVYLGPGDRGRTRAGDRRSSSGSSTTSSTIRRSCRRTGPGDLRGARHRLRSRDDRPLRDGMALIKDTSVEQVREAADMVEIVGARTQLRRVGARWVGPLPVPRRAHAELLGQPRDEALLLLRLRPGRRSVHVRAGDRGARLRPGGRVARRALPRPARVRGVLTAG